jgi:hypothetical protein
MKAAKPVFVSNGVPYFQMSPVGSHSISRRDKEGKKERKGGMNMVNLTLKCNY